MRFGRSVSCSARRLAAVALCIAGLGVATRARAQEIEPFAFVPLPAGTNLLLWYQAYGHLTDYNVARGQTFKDSKLEINASTFTYERYFDVAGHPAALEVFDTFSSYSGGNVGGLRLGSAFGSTNPTVAAVIWPYVNTATGSNVFLGGFLSPPLGSYDRRSRINIGDNRWRGTLQLGLTQALGPRFSFEAAFDTQFYGNNNRYYPGSTRLSQDNTYRAQIWANWRWNPALTTSLGYEGFFGGSQRSDGVFNGNKTEEQRLRANAAYFVTPALQAMLDLTHDVHVTGGYNQAFGAQIRLLYIF